VAPAADAGAVCSALANGTVGAAGVLPAGGFGANGRAPRGVFR
jgi:hypothetical protein